MNKNIEVEIRGPLTKKQFQDLKTYLTQNGRFISQKSRLSLMYFYKKIPQDVKEIRSEIIDLRLRITNGQAAIVMKYGRWGGSDIRKEFEFPIDKTKFIEAIDFLKILGWTKAVAYATNASIYQYKQIEFAVIEIKNFGYVYEAEILVKNKKEIALALKRVKNICSHLGLREYRPNEFERQCNQINNTKKLQFDFSRTPFNVFKKRFKEFFK